VESSKFYLNDFWLKQVYLLLRIFFGLIFKQHRNMWWVFLGIQLIFAMILFLFFLEFRKYMLMLCCSATMEFWIQHHLESEFFSL
jgi:hypothetical protein